MLPSLIVSGRQVPVESSLVLCTPKAKTYPTLQQLCLQTSHRCGGTLHQIERNLSIHSLPCRHILLDCPCTELLQPYHLPPLTSNQCICQRYARYSANDCDNQHHLVCTPVDKPMWKLISDSSVSQLVHYRHPHPVSFSTLRYW